MESPINPLNSENEIEEGAAPTESTPLMNEGRRTSYSMNYSLMRFFMLF